MSDDLNASQQEKKTNFEAFMKLMRKSGDLLKIINPKLCSPELFHVLE